MAFKKNVGDEERRKFDSFVHAVTVITEPHRMTHDGFVFHVSGKVTGLTDGGQATMLLKNPAGNFPHLHKLNMSFGGGDIDVGLYEDPTTTDDGTLVPSLNTNRNSSNTANMGIYVAPTVTDIGTELHTIWVPPSAAGVGQAADGVVGVSEGEEWLLAPGTDYLKVIMNNSGNTISFFYEFLWYEVGYEK